MYIVCIETIPDSLPYVCVRFFFKNFFNVGSILRQVGRPSARFRVRVRSVYTYAVSEREGNDIATVPRSIQRAAYSIFALYGLNVLKNNTRKTLLNNCALKMPRKIGAA